MAFTDLAGDFQTISWNEVRVDVDIHLIRRDQTPRTATGGLSDCQVIKLSWRISGFELPL